MEFRSAQSTHAVCSFCRSTVVRDGATLSRVGKMAELFEDHSPVQLLARGTWRQRAFTVVGRLQYRGPTGAWAEWNCLFEDGSSAWLAEDNGAYVFAQPAPEARGVPEAARLPVGHVRTIGGKAYTVAANEQVALVAAEGELQRLPPLQVPFAMVELRSADNEVLSIDYGSQPPAVTRGRPVALDELAFTGLREGNVKAASARQFACPHCGATVEVQFTGSRSITCCSCHSLIDLDSGIGGELRHAEQDEPVEPVIPLGRTGQLQGVHWQVVGFQHRLGTEPDDPDEHFGWTEYLLYNAKRGFCFLVDSEEGWSLVRPVTGAPVLADDLRTAKYLGTTYQLQYTYRAQTNFVEGEFYFPVQRGQASSNRDYASGDSVLSMEETSGERTWSLGSRIDSSTVAKAFGMQPHIEAFRRGDVGPVSSRGGGTGCGCATLILVVVILLLVVIVLKACEEQDGAGGSGSGGGGSSGSSYRSSGGGWSSGGAHK